MYVLNAPRIKRPIIVFLRPITSKITPLIIRTGIVTNYAIEVAFVFRAVASVVVLEKKLSSVRR